MSKPVINTLIKKLSLSGQTTKITPWLVEGIGESDKMDVRYVGLKPDESWDMILSPEDNLLLKFSIHAKTDYLTIYFANRPPFVELWNKSIGPTDTWEGIIGKLKQRLKKEAAEDARGDSTIQNLYHKIKPLLKKPRYN